MNATDGDHTRTRPYRTRTWVFFARDAPLAVILRRGPRRANRLIRWNLKDDTFEAGQWMSGIVYLSDLSPDGSKIVYRAAQYRRPRSRPLSLAFDPMLTKPPPRGQRRHRAYRRIPRYQRLGPDGTEHPPRPVHTNWTAISVPPYFTALAFWPSRGSWTGGGRFVTNHELVLYETEDGMTPHVHVEMPRDFRVLRYVSGETSMPAGIYPAYGATSQDDGPVYRVLMGLGLRNLDWVTSQISRDLLFAADGCIYRLADWKSVRESDFLARARVLTDLRDMTFENIAPPPSALHW